MSQSQLLDLENVKSGSNKKLVKTAAFTAGAGAGAIALTEQPASAQTAVDDAVTQITALPTTLGAIVGSFVTIGVAVMGVNYAFRIARRVRG